MATSRTIRQRRRNRPADQVLSSSHFRCVAMAKVNPAPNKNPGAVIP